MNLPPALVELMAAAGYEAYRTKAPSLPPWLQCNEHYRDAARNEMSAGLLAALRAGRITITDPTTPATGAQS